MKYLLIISMLLCVGCEKKPDVGHVALEKLAQETLTAFEEALSRIYALEEADVSIRRDNGYFFDRQTAIMHRLDALEKQAEYDPNTPELSFLEATDPNWARDYGDTEETRKLFNISVNRARIVRAEKITAEIARRFLAMEALIVDPNEERDLSNIEIRPAGRKSDRPVQNEAVDPNEVKK